MKAVEAFCKSQQCEFTSTTFNLLSLHNDVLGHFDEYLPRYSQVFTIKLPPIVQKPYCYVSGNVSISHQMSFACHFEISKCFDKPE